MDEPIFIGYKAKSDRLEVRFEYPMAEYCQIEFILEEKKTNEEGFISFDKYELDVTKGKREDAITFAKELSSEHNVEYKINGVVRKVYDNIKFDEKIFKFSAIYSVPFQGNNTFYFLSKCSRFI